MATHERNDGKPCFLCLGTPEECKDDIACLRRLLCEIGTVADWPWWRRKRKALYVTVGKLSLLAMLLEPDEDDRDGGVETEGALP
jgi:hypothetical protein